MAAVESSPTAGDTGSYLKIVRGLSGVPFQKVARNQGQPAAPLYIKPDFMTLDALRVTWSATASILFSFKQPPLL